MQRSKFPYSVRSSAKIVRHAVSIDERRAKFRSDLISGKGPSEEGHPGRHHLHHRKKRSEELNGDKTKPELHSTQQSEERFRRPSRVRLPRGTDEVRSQLGKGDGGDGLLKPRQKSPDGSQMRAQSPVSSIYSNASQFSMPPQRPREDDDDLDEAAAQDLEELWFPGCHADIGGGWPVSAGEELPLSHGPLVWMVKEAERAGLNFDRDMVVKLKCGDDFQGDRPGFENSASAGDPAIPAVQITSSSDPDLFSGPHSEKQNPGWARGFEPEASHQSEFHRALHEAGTKGRLHDCLKFKNGLGAMSVISWKMMEYLPFRRMDLRPDGSWAAISFP